MDLTSKFLEKSYEYNIKSHGVRLPTFDVSTEDKKANDAESDISNIDFLKLLTQNGFRNLEKDGKIDTAKKEDYLNRVKYEMSVVEELGFTDYFLMVWDVINFCRKNEIPTGRGRGSCAGSLVLYLIGVTKIDPIRYGLIFERFISKVRAKKQIIDGITYLDGSLMCDVDMDICYYNRHRVLEYLDERYKGKTCKIGTVSTLSGKLLIKEVGKIVGGKSETEMNLVSKMIPTIFGQVKDIESLYNEEGENNEFRDWCNKNKRVYEIALKLRDLIKNKGVHASGVAISYGPIEETVPLELTKDKEIVSGYDKDLISELTVKLDCLGLKSVSVVDQCCKLIGIKENSIDVENPFIYQCYQEDIKLHGLFQIEADLAGKALKKIKPRNLDELSAVLALARPGAMQFIDDFAKFTASGTYKGVHPFFDVILKDTAALCLFQEQLLQMVVAIGFTLEDAETVRRIIGRKKIEEMKLWEEKIKSKIQERSLDPKIGEVLWKIADDSSKYSFNKCIYEEETVETRNGQKELKNVVTGDVIKAYDTKNYCDIFVTVLDVMENRKEVFEIELDSGKKIATSLEHKFLTEQGMVPLAQIIKNDLKIAEYGEYFLTWSPIISCQSLGVKRTIDLEVDHPDHNFYANGIVVSNSHSSAYASLTAATTYLKFRHPKEFFLSLLRMTRHEQDSLGEVAKIQKEMVKFGIKLLPPDICKSELDFSIEGENIRFGLSSIKGIGDKELCKLSSLKAYFDNKIEIFKAAKTSKINSGAFAALIQAGVIEQLKEKRSYSVLEYRLWNILKPKEQIFAETIAKDHNYNVFDIVRFMSKTTNDKGTLLIKESRLNTIKKEYEPHKEVYTHNSKNEDFANWYFEYKLIGFSCHSTLRDIFSKKTPDLVNIEEALKCGEKEPVKIVGIVKDTYLGTSRNKNKYLRIELTDESSDVTVFLFDTEKKGQMQSSYELSMDINSGKNPKEGDIVIVEGRRKEDVIFAELVVVKNNKVYIKLGDIKNDSKEKEKEDSVS